MIVLSAKDLASVYPNKTLKGLQMKYTSLKKEVGLPPNKSLTVFHLATILEVDPFKLRKMLLDNPPNSPASTPVN